MNDSQQDSLVIAKCEELYHVLSRDDPNVRACVIIKASIPKETNNLTYSQEVDLGGWGYSVYAGFQGSWIKNNGARGFESWCVYGQNHQTDNIIYID